jgi:flagellar basal body-associated protein FliL
VAERDPAVFSLFPVGKQSPNPATGVLRCTLEPPESDSERGSVSLLWIILIVILVLALLGFFTRGRW